MRSTGISLQAMDNSHVALVALLMRQDGFEHYRCGESCIAPRCVARGVGAWVVRVNLPVLPRLVSF